MALELLLQGFALGDLDLHLDSVDLGELVVVVLIRLDFDLDLDLHLDFVVLGELVVVVLVHLDFDLDLGALGLLVVVVLVRLD